MRISFGCFMFSCWKEEDVFLIEATRETALGKDLTTIWFYLFGKSDLLFEFAFSSDDVDQRIFQ